MGLWKNARDRGQKLLQQQNMLRQYDTLLGNTAKQLQDATGCTEEQAFSFMKGYKLTVPTLTYIQLCAIGRNKEEGAAKSLEEVGVRLKEFIAS